MKKKVLYIFFIIIALTIVAHFSSFAAETHNQQGSISVSELIGSIWRLIYDNPNFGHREYDLIFRENGKLINTHPNEQTPNDDTWEINGNKIVLKFNNAYAVYTGQLSDRDHMSGSATSKAGGNWKWKAFRVNEAKK